MQTKHIHQPIFHTKHNINIKNQHKKPPIHPKTISKHQSKTTKIQKKN